MGTIHTRFAACVVALLLLAASGVTTGCGGSGGNRATSENSGFVSDEYMRERALDYLRFATQSFSPGNVNNVMLHMERDLVDPTYSVPANGVPENAWDGIFDKLERLQDTRDFDGLYFVNLLLAYRDHPMLPPALVQRVEDVMIGFKMWYTEPTPAGMIDDSWYWTENHQILFHTIEYLIGQTYPDRVFPNDGRTGAEHRDEARRLLLRWMDLRARVGFSEFHSNVYYQKNITPLLTLVEFAEEDDIRERAAGLLDILFLDLALHSFRGAFAGPRARTEKKDKMGSLNDNTWGGVKLLFDRSTYPYQSTSHPDALFLARAKKYRLPEAILRIAQHDEPYSDRERMGIDINEFGPWHPDPPAPLGLSFTDPDQLTIWWGIGALITWQVVPLTIATMNDYNLWESALFLPFADIRTLAGDPRIAQSIAISTTRFLNFGLLKEVNTYVHRTADYMLASAQDYRAGSRGWEHHSWQATFDANAIVFTNHPNIPPRRTTNWRDDPDAGYWTGEASKPRSAQHENVGIHIYAPQYSPPPAPFDIIRYEPYTHAYFPQDHFDEVVQAEASDGGSWTFGRFQDGYVGLYSFRPTEWIVYDPNEYATDGMVKPFDLHAPGGPNNVWIVECGRAADWESFAAFRTALTTARIDVTPLGPLHFTSTGFAVEYESPSQGVMTFGFDGRPLTVDGQEIQITDYPRFSNPWAQTPFGSQQYEITYGDYRVELDFEAATRVVTGP